MIFNISYFELNSFMLWTTEIYANISFKIRGGWKVEGYDEEERAADNMLVV